MLKTEIASLTKLMTLWVSLKIIHRYNIPIDTYINITNPYITISQIIGTSANLPENYCLTINDLFYGMILPSGNDAAALLAVFFGDLLLKNIEDGNEIKEVWKWEKSKTKETPIERFV